jgi:hypothetical protein
MGDPNWGGYQGTGWVVLAVLGVVIMDSLGALLAAMLSRWILRRTAGAIGSDQGQVDTIHAS